MGFLDKAKDALQGKGDQAEDLIDKAADVVDDKTGGKHTDKIDAAADKAKDVIDKLDTSDE
ncbi:MAG: antitoxin [Acidimicrobiales bacterium]|nr:antitoxin [Acidimicrobiales bacterium]